MSNQITIPVIDASTIYEGGSISQIKAEELENNIVAIRQLINSHNVVAVSNKNKDTEIQSLKSEIEYLKTSPFISIISALLNIIGSILIGISVNLITSENAPSTKNILIIACGALLVIISSFSTILYPFARKWFNK